MRSRNLRSKRLPGEQNRWLESVILESKEGNPWVALKSFGDGGQTHLPVSMTPLVLGISPVIRSSTLAAASKARPKALNNASAL
jgi:hypothetical protein